jgi:bisphosphoglycerate-dependent phosphoglycerate mutase
LVVAEVRETLAVAKRPVNKMDMGRLNLKKLNEEESYGTVSGYNKKQIFSFGELRR